MLFGLLPKRTRLSQIKCKLFHEDFPNLKQKEIIASISKNHGIAQVMISRL